MKLFNVLLAVIQKMKMLRILTYKSFSFLNGWGSSNNSLIAVKIGSILFLTGTLLVGTTTSDTIILQLPGELTSANNYQYITAHGWGVPTPGYMLRVQGRNLKIDNNYDIPTNIRELYISGIIVLNVEGGRSSLTLKRGWVLC